MRMLWMLLLVFPSLVSAHESKAYMTPNGYWSDSVVVDGKELPIGILGYFGALEGHMTSNPEAEQYAHNARDNARLSGLFLLGGLGGAITYAFAAQPGTFQSGVYWSIFVAGFIPAVIFGRYAQMAFTRAINTYNGVGSKKSSYHVTPMLAPVKDGGTVGMQLTF